MGHLVDGHVANPRQFVDAISNREILSNLERCIEYSEAGNADRLAQIIRYIQLVRARFDSSHFAGAYPQHELDWAKLNHNKTSYIIDWAVLATICNSAFGFARGSVSSIPTTITINDVQNTLMTTHIFPELYPKLEELIVERGKGHRLERNFSAD